MVFNQVLEHASCCEVSVSGNQNSVDASKTRKQLNENERKSENKHRNIAERNSQTIQTDLKNVA